MHNCDYCHKPSNYYIGRPNKYMCEPCFVDVYKIPVPIKAEVQLKDIGKIDTVVSS